MQAYLVHECIWSKRCDKSDGGKDPSPTVVMTTSQGIRLTSQSKFIITNVKECLKEEKRKGKSIMRESVNERLVKVTGISARIDNKVNHN